MSVTEGSHMGTCRRMATKFCRQQSGASFLEYTALLGFIVVLVIGTIQMVGAWSGGQWTTLNASLTNSGGSGGGNDCCANSNSDNTQGNCCN